MYTYLIRIHYILLFSNLDKYITGRFLRSELDFGTILNVLLNFLTSLLQQILDVHII